MWTRRSEAASRFRVLIFYSIGGFANTARLDFNTLITEIGKREGFAVDIFHEASVFSEANLKRYSVVVMNNTSELGKLLDSTRQKSLMGYHRNGGHVGIHLSAETFGTFPSCTEYMGATRPTIAALPGGLVMRSTDLGLAVEVHSQGPHEVELLSLQGASLEKRRSQDPRREEPAL